MATKNWRVHVNKILANYKKYDEYKRFLELAQLDPQQDTEKAELLYGERCEALVEKNQPLEKFTLDNGATVWVNINSQSVYVRIQMPAYWTDTVSVSKRIDYTWKGGEQWEATQIKWSSGGTNADATEEEAIDQHIEALKIAKKIKKDFEELDLDRFKRYGKV